MCVRVCASEYKVLLVYDFDGTIVTIIRKKALAHVHNELSPLDGAHLLQRGDAGGTPEHNSS